MSDQAQRVDPRTRTIILVVVTIATFLNPFTGSSINLALPVIGEEFGIDAVILSWIPTSYLLSTAIFLLPAGRFGDLMGRGRVFVWGTLIYTFASFLTIFTPSVPFLLGCRFLQGFGSAMVFSNAVAIIAEIYPPGERGRALGLNVMAVYGGLTLGPFLGGLLTQYLGWRSIFGITILLGAGVLASAHLLPPSLSEGRKEPFDIRGAAFSAMIMVLFFLGISTLPEIAGVVAVISSLGLLFVFIRMEEATASPLFPVRLFRENRSFTYSNASALINYSATFAVTFLMSLYLQVVQGFSPAFAGLVLLVQPMVQMIFSPFTGKLSDRVPPENLASLGLIVSAASLFGFSFLQEDSSLSLVILLLVLLGIGLALFSAPNTNAIMSAVSRHHYGVASAMLATMRSLGMMMSMGMVMIAFALLLGNIPVSPAMAGPFLKSMQAVFLVLFSLSICGAVVSWRRGVHSH
ncbi:MAG: MFS transporter [Methanolinea sp.]|jgi:EmrB/QacA subfamily drug resistance transporter|nr:MFS transporter [Methanolinea sp.]